MVLKYLFLFFVLYLLYKIVFGFVIPVYKATRQLRQQMNGMQDAMRQQYESQQAYQEHPEQTTQAKGTQPPKSTDRGEYIDFEEIK
ncbi:DUF4834 family protein [Chitinophaga sp. Cy-1792]|uniref:DUF4834 family protein n=1 Tax=Chitinophaga sp. Cy-1792 TaxID=2608339 RepID=UPI00141FCC7E|nr:DUF4834 family protein [Chitinophaga sp. Cy-1792]NIG52501.1 DUF4834 family protein [Chitinophaga sp. Cy-1792]